MALKEDIASKIDECTVQCNELQCSEYCFKFVTDYNTKMKDSDPLLAQCLDISITALLNTSGGVVSVRGTTECPSVVFDEWKRALAAQLNTLLPKDIFMNYLHVEDQGSPVHTVHIVVKASPGLVTYKYGLFVRKGSESYMADDKASAISVIETNGDFAPTVNIPAVFEYGKQVDLQEKEDVELKYWKTKTHQHIMSHLHEKRTQKSLFALPNLPGGGNFFIGVHEDPTHKVSVTYGQLLEEEHEQSLKDAISQLLKRDKAGVRRIWGTEMEELTYGKHWELHFYPVINCPDTKRRVVIRIELKHCPEGFFAHKPEAYIISEEGAVKQLTFHEWKKNISEYEADEDYIDEITVERSYPVPQPEPDSTQSEARRIGRPEQSPTVIDTALAEASKLSFTKHSRNWQKHLKVDLNLKDDRMTQDLFQLSNPLHFIPSRDIIGRSQLDQNLIAKCISMIETTHAPQKGVALATTMWLQNITTNTADLLEPPHHQMDFLSFDQSCLIYLWGMCDDEGSDEEETQQKQISYLRVSARRIKWHLMKQIRKIPSLCSRWSCYINIGWCGPNSTERHVTDMDRICNTYYKPMKNWKYLQGCLGILIWEKNTYIKQRLGSDRLIHLTTQQMAQITRTNTTQFNLIEGPPGSGKSILATYLCKKYGKSNSVVVNSNPCLCKYWAFQDVCHVELVRTDADMKDFLEKEIIHRAKVVVIDDGQNIRCSPEMWMNFFDTIRKKRHIKLFIFADNDIQNYQTVENTVNMKEELNRFTKRYTVSYMATALATVHRNTQKVSAFLARDVDHFQIECGHPEAGDDVEFIRVENLHTYDQNDGLLKLLKDLLDSQAIIDGAPTSYEASHVAILIEASDSHDVISKYRSLLAKHLQGVTVHGADTFPVTGIVVDSVDSFSGLDAEVVLLIVSSDNLLQNKKYKAFIASRAIYKVMFVTDQMLNHKSVEIMNTDILPQTEERKERKNTQRLLPDEEFAEETSAPSFSEVELLWTNRDHEAIYDVTFMADGSLIFTSGRLQKDEHGVFQMVDTKLFRWNTKGESLEVPFTTHYTNNMGLAARSGAVVVSGRESSGDRSVTLYTKRHGTWAHQTFPGHDADRVAINSNYSIVCAKPNSLWCLDDSGATLWQVDLVSDPNNYAPHVTVDMKDHVIVSNTNIHQISVYSAQGELLTNFPSDAVEIPSGVCVDSFGRLLVGDWKNRSVYLFNMKGEFIQNLVYVRFRHGSISLYGDKYLIVNRYNALSMFQFE